MFMVIKMMLFLLQYVMTIKVMLFLLQYVDGDKDHDAVSTTIC